MKKTALLIIFILLAGLALTGCIKITPIEAPAADKTPAIAAATTPLPQAAETEAPEPAATETFPGLSPHFPAGRITLPPGSKVLEVFDGTPDPYGVTAEYLETTVLELPLTKTEAVEYFSKMLDKGDTDYFDSGETPYQIPSAITDAYPDVSNVAEVYATYVHSTDVRSIYVRLFTQDSGEKVFAAYIQVAYAKKPGTSAPAPTELSIASLRQACEDRNYMLHTDYLFAKTDGVTLVDGFEIWIELKSGVTENIIFLELSDAAGIEKYLWYRDGYTLAMTYGLIYVEYHEDTDEVRGFIQDIVKAAGGK